MYYFDKSLELLSIFPQLQSGIMWLKSFDSHRKSVTNSLSLKDGVHVVQLSQKL